MCLLSSALWADSILGRGACVLSVRSPVCNMQEQENCQAAPPGAGPHLQRSAMAEAAMDTAEPAEAAPAAPAPAAAKPAAAKKGKLTDRQTKNALAQIEFYFSDSNLPRDACVPPPHPGAGAAGCMGAAQRILRRARRFLLDKVTTDPQGYVDLQLVCSFSRMRDILKAGPPLLQLPAAPQLDCPAAVAWAGAPPA